MYRSAGCGVEEDDGMEIVEWCIMSDALFTIPGVRWWYLGCMTWDTADLGHVAGCLTVLLYMYDHA